MKIAFVAKGGSGKSTITSLFLRYLEEQKKQHLCVDADINMHMMDILGIHMDRQKGISFGDNSTIIKEYLKGANKKIQSASHIVKTTPPSKDSNFLYIKINNPLIRQYAVPIKEYGHLMHVGTYEEGGIGESCYHTNLSIFEALISHTITDENHVLAVDMTAGTDAFAGALHAQFDLVCLIVEPTKESVSLAKEYLHLAQKGNVLKFIGVVGNKIEDGDDIAYIENELGLSVFASVPLMKELKHLRRGGQSIFALSEDIFQSISFDAIFEKSKENMSYADERLALLHDLHKKHASADYIVGRYGDITGQIDLSFSYTDMTYGES